MRQITETEAKLLFETKWWEQRTDEEAAEYQFLQDRLCMPFDEFHRCMEVRLGRSVWTHEFAFRDKLHAEMFDGAEPPSMDDIINLIPEEKRVIVLGGG